MVVAWIVRLTNASDHAYHIEYVPGLMEWQTPKVDGCLPPYVVLPGFSTNDIHGFAIPHSGSIRIWCTTDESCKVEVFIGGRPGQFEGEDWLQFRTPSGVPVGIARWQYMGQSQMFGGRHVDLHCTFVGALSDGVDKAIQFVPFSPNEPDDVLLNVYDLADQVSSFNGFFANSVYNLFGFFHTGIEVYGEEWSFYRTEGPECGICRSRMPKNHSVHVFRQTVNLGKTKLDKRKVLEVLMSKLRFKWRGDTYDLLDRNCISFCSAFAKALGANEIPSWVSNLHESASSVTTAFPFLKPYIYGESDIDCLDSTTNRMDDGDNVQSDSEIDRRRNMRRSTIDERIAEAVSASSRPSHRIMDHPWPQTSFDAYESLVFLDDISDI